MHLKFRNVNDCFKSLVEGIHNGEIQTTVSPSRVGEVLQIDEPVTITYNEPRERVLFNRARDCNPFMHLYESLWMLAGRNDVAPMQYYSSKIADIASDDGMTFNGAYGYRWRHAKVPRINPATGVATLAEVDQLKVIIDQLKRKPESRRVVLQMWNVADDLLKIDDTKDVACNTNVYFSVERGTCVACDGWGWHNKEKCPICNGLPHEVPHYLNMTVCNRSNDMIWGMLGANVVHFSFLQEYIAACLGLDVGRYHQFTNNLHVYTETNGGFHPEKWLAEYQRDMHSPPAYERMYQEEKFQHVPLVKDQATFDQEVADFVERHSKNPHNWIGVYSEPFLRWVAQPMCVAFHYHKQRDYHSALSSIQNVAADDWRAAGKMWLLKRQANWEKKQGESVE